MGDTYRILLIDLDNTILDFTKTEREALVTTFANYGVVLEEEEIRQYNRINDKCWKMLERGEVNKEELKRLRFTEFVSLLPKKPKRDVMDINADYMKALAGLAIPLPGAEEAVCCLAKDYRLAIITNGTDWVQKSRFSKMSCAGCFEALFISDELGAQKPAPLFFDTVKEAMGDREPSHYLVVGDSISSDILGGTWAGMDTCLVSAVNTDENVATYRIASLLELPKLLLKLS